MVKVEFGERGLGESPKVDCTAETPAEFNYNATMSCTYDDPTALDEIAHKPVICKFSSHCLKNKGWKIVDCSKCFSTKKLIQLSYTHKYQGEIKYIVLIAVFLNNMSLNHFNSIYQ